MYCFIFSLLFNFIVVNFLINIFSIVPIMYSCNHCSNMYKSRAWMEKHLNREHPTGKLVDFTEIQMERPVLDTSQ